MLNYTIDSYRPHSIFYYVVSEIGFCVIATEILFGVCTLGTAKTAMFICWLLLVLDLSRRFRMLAEDEANSEIINLLAIFCGAVVSVIYLSVMLALNSEALEIQADSGVKGVMLGAVIGIVSHMATRLIVSRK